MPLTQSYKKVKDGVVQVLALNGHDIISFGSGSIIGPGNVVLTCEHCIVPGTQTAIRNPNNQNMALNGNVIFSNKSPDVALIEFPNIIGTPVCFGNSDGCEVGNGAFVVGFPMGIIEKTLLSAHIACISNGFFRIDASVNHGNSGGPLFNMDGKQIGVINAKHGSLPQFLETIEHAQPNAKIIISGIIDPVETLQALIREMKINLNLGIGYAIPTEAIKNLHPVLQKYVL